MSILTMSHMKNQIIYKCSSLLKPLTSRHVLVVPCYLESRYISEQNLSCREETSFGYGVLMFPSSMPIGTSFCLLHADRRYLQWAVIPAFSFFMLGNPEYALILVGMSSVGILFGSLSAFTLKFIKSPLLWLRIGALLLLLVWVIPFSNSSPGVLGDALRLSLVMIPISFGWAAGDVSLARYVPSLLEHEQNFQDNISVLGSVMSFLYISHIFLYLILSISLGLFIDKEFPVDPQKGLVFLGGTQFTVIAAVVLASTFVPKGSFNVNPDIGVASEEQQQQRGIFKQRSRYTAIFTNSAVSGSSQPMRPGEMKKSKITVTSKLIGSTTE